MYIVSDFIAKIGLGKTGSAVGEYKLGKRDERGDILERFVEKYRMKCNTQFR